MKPKTGWVIAVIAVMLVIAFCLYPRKTGYLRVTTPGLMLNLHRSPWGHVLVGPSAEPKAVSVGTYTPSYANYVQQENGDKWQVHCTWSRSVSGLQVLEGETVDLDYGPPFQFKPQVKHMGHIVSMGLHLTGRSGERYDIAVQKNGRPLPPPKLSVLDAGGDTLATGQFEYG